MLMSKSTTDRLIPSLRFPEFNDKGDWSMPGLDTIAEPIDERTGTNLYTNMSVTSGSGLISQKEKFGREISGSQYKNYYVIRRFDFAYNKSATKLYPEGTMAIILPHGVLFRGGAEERIRTKLLKDGHIDTVIGLPANLFFSTGIPVCILVLKKCKKFDDVLFINASEHYEKGKRQNRLRDGGDGEPNDIKKIIETYQYRPEKIERYARRVSMAEIEKNDFNLNISRYVSITQDEETIDLKAVHDKLVEIERKAKEARDKHNKFLKELGLPPI